MHSFSNSLYWLKIYEKPGIIYLRHSIGRNEPEPTGQIRYVFFKIAEGSVREDRHEIVGEIHRHRFKFVCYWQDSRRLTILKAS